MLLGVGWDRLNTFFGLKLGVWLRQMRGKRALEGWLGQLRLGVGNNLLL